MAYIPRFTLRELDLLYHLVYNAVLNSDRECDRVIFELESVLDKITKLSEDYRIEATIKSRM